MFTLTVFVDICHRHLHFFEVPLNISNILVSQTIIRWPSDLVEPHADVNACNSINEERLETKPNKWIFDGSDQPNYYRASSYLLDIYRHMSPLRSSSTNINRLPRTRTKIAHIHWLLIPTGTVSLSSVLLQMKLNRMLSGLVETHNSSSKRLLVGN